MPFSLLLLLVCWLGLFGVIHELSLKFGKSWSLRDTFLAACVAWGSVLVALTELLSLFHAIQQTILRTAWLVLAVAALAYYGYLWRRRTAFNLKTSGGNFREKDALGRLFSPLQFAKVKFEPVPLLIAGMLAIIVFQFITLAMVGYFYPPTNNDSMTYHLARVIYWQQQQSVAHFATNNDWQIHLNPFAEFVILHLQVLLAEDRFANLVQWFAMLICAVGISNITRKLGGDKYAQVIAALLTVSIPMGILQASTTQNDFVEAAMLVCFINFSLSLIKIERQNQLFWVIATGLALGLAVLAKGTSFPFALPFCIVFGVVVLRRWGWAAWRAGLAIVGLVLSLNLGHFTRNLMLYGSPTGPVDLYTNKLVSLEGLASNVIRNMALHFQPIDRTNWFFNTLSTTVLSWLRLLHNLTGLSVTDPRTTWDTDRVNIFISPSPPFSEEFAGNTFHLILIILVLLFTFSRRVSGLVKAYNAALVSGFLLFCLTTKWQVWGSRLQLPLFVLWCASIAVVLFPPSPKAISKVWLAVPLLVAVLGLVWTFNNEDRPITLTANYDTPRRTDVYLKTPLYRDFALMAKVITEQKCDRVGIDVANATPEYVLWLMLRDYNFTGTIEHVYVKKPSRIYAQPNFKPCAVMAYAINPDLDGRFIERKYGSGYYLYTDPNLMPPPSTVPNGFTLDPQLSVSVWSGWYDWESQLGIRWTQSPSRFWLYSEKPATVKLRLTPGGMNVNKGLGTEGSLKVSVNRAIINPALPVVTSQPTEIEIKVEAGFNPVQFELAAGNFSPGGGDSRQLGISFSSIDIRIVQ